MKNTKLVGILNITPDSFSDGGAYNNSLTAAKQLELMLSAKPDIIDIGAISTRPNSKIPSVAEEIARFDAILPAITLILKVSSMKISIDTYNFETAKYLLNLLPIAWINDQSGFIDQQMINLVKDTEIKLVIMHHLTIPADPQKIVPENLDIVLVVKNWLLEKAKYLINQGIKPEQIILDPGIGFGKSAIQSWQLIKEAKSLVNLGYPIMYGHSRKSFLNLVTDQDFSERDLETAILSTYLTNCGVDYLRVHNLKANLRALKLKEFI